MQNPEEIQLLSPVFWSLPFSDSWWTSIILLPDLYLDLSRSHSHHCHLQAESCVSARLCKLCAWKALHFPCNFSFAWFQIATLSKVSNIFKPFQSISHLNCQRRSKCLYGHTAGSRFCGLLKNMQKSKYMNIYNLYMWTWQIFMSCTYWLDALETSRWMIGFQIVWYPKKPSNKKSQRLSPTSTFSPSLSVSMVTVSSSSGSSGSGGATPSTSEARCSRRSLNESYRDPFLGKKTSTKMMRCTITSYKNKIFPSTKIGFVGNFRCFFLGGGCSFQKSFNRKGWRSLNILAYQTQP